jgi:hypothetical protein
MSDYRRSVRTTTTVVYELDAPANWVEVSKVFSAIRQELASEFDDIVTVHPMDETIEIRVDAKWLAKDGVR